MSAQNVNPETSGSAPTSDREASDVECLFREHNAALLRFISAKVGSEQEAWEIAQEAYVHLLRLDRPEAISYLRAFLFKIAANLAVDRMRQRRRRTEVTAVANMDFAVFELSPERQIAGEQALALFGTAVEELPAKCRQAFLLHRVQELPVDEIARQMNIGACMVRRYIARAMDYIRFRLDAAGSHQLEPER